MRTLNQMVFLAVLAAGVLATGCGNKDKNPEAEQRVAEAEKALAEANAEAASRKQMSAQLEAKLDEVATALTATADRLKVSSAENQRLKAANQKRLEDAKTAAKVPLPIVTNGDFRFPKLVNSKLELVAENVEYSTRFGRTLIFRSDDGKRLKFDIDQLHSVVLSVLGIDADTAKADQARIDAVDKAIADRTAKGTAVTAAATDNKDGAAPAAQPDDRQHALEGDRIEADAAIKRAIAALNAAPKP